MRQRTKKYRGIVPLTFIIAFILLGLLCARKAETKDSSYAPVDRGNPPSKK